MCLMIEKTLLFITNSAIIENHGTYFNFKIEKV